MNIVVMSRREIENMVFDHPCVVISISEPGFDDACIKGNSKVQDILRLQFHDTEGGKIIGFGGDQEPEALREMTMEQGLQVVDFIEKWRDRVGTIYVHCHAGMSRSPGVAVAICQMLRQRSNQFYGNGRFPNRHVAWTIVTAWRNKKHGDAIHLLFPGALLAPLCQTEDVRTTNEDREVVTCRKCKSIMETADRAEKAFTELGRPEPALDGKCLVVEVKEETDGRKAC